MSFACQGARAEGGNRLRGTDTQNTEGVRGLKALGVRDLAYKMAYLACMVIPCNKKVKLSLHYGTDRLYLMKVDSWNLILKPCKSQVVI